MSPVTIFPIMLNNNRASGLGKACVEQLCKAGGYVAILDMNEESGQELVEEIGGGKTKFFECNVLETDSVAAAVKGALEWSKETGKLLGGVVAAAGVANPAKVCVTFPVDMDGNVLELCINCWSTKMVIGFQSHVIYDILAWLSIFINQSIQKLQEALTSSQIIDKNLKPFSLDDFDFVMNVNVRGTIDLIRQVLPHIAKADPVGEDGERGIVIMVASSAAFDGQPGQGQHTSIALKIP